MPFGFRLTADTLPSGILRDDGFRSALSVSGFRLRAQLDVSIPSHLSPASEALPPLSDMAPLIRAPEGLQPSGTTRCPAHTMAESDFSRPFIIGYGSSPSRCGPALAAAGQTGDLPVPKQGACVRARVFDHAEPNGVLAISRSVVLPYALSTASALRISKLSRLNGWPARTPVNASPHVSRHTAHDSGTTWFARPSLYETCTLYSLPVSRRTDKITSLYAGGGSRPHRARGCENVDPLAPDACYASYSGSGMAQPGCESGTRLRPNEYRSTYRPFGRRLKEK
jgi:hypothetical protein